MWRMEKVRKSYEEKGVTICSRMLDWSIQYIEFLLNIMSHNKNMFLHGLKTQNLFGLLSPHQLNPLEKQATNKIHTWFRLMLHWVHNVILITCWSRWFSECLLLLYDSGQIGNINSNFKSMFHIDHMEIVEAWFTYDAKADVVPEGECQWSMGR